MRKIIWFNMMTLDGFFEGPDREIDWHNVDAEFNDFAAAQLDSMDMLLFGRTTYEMMASYGPTPMAVKDDPVIAEKMNTKDKIVYSTTLKKAEWSHTRLIQKNAMEETAQLKGQPGKDLAIFGSASLANRMLEAGLIDEVRAMVNPILLGSGHPMFSGGEARQNLKLLNARTFGNGNVLLVYQPMGKAKEKKAWDILQQTV